MPGPRGRGARQSAAARRRRDPGGAWLQRRGRAGPDAPPDARPPRSDEQVAAGRAADAGARPPTGLARHRRGRARGGRQPDSPRLERAGRRRLGARDDHRRGRPQRTLRHRRRQGCQRSLGQADPGADSRRSARGAGVQAGDRARRPRGRDVTALRIELPEHAGTPDDAGTIASRERDREEFEAVLATAPRPDRIRQVVVEADSVVDAILSQAETSRSS